MKRVPLSEVKDDLSRYVQLAAHEEIVVTRHGRPAAVLIGFEDEDDLLDVRRRPSLRMAGRDQQQAANNRNKRLRSARHAANRSRG